MKTDYSKEQPVIESLGNKSLILIRKINDLKVFSNYI